MKVKGRRRTLRITLQERDSLIHPSSFILHPSQVLDLLGQLVDKSLVMVEQKKDKHVRYRLLETIRQYARGKLVDCGREAAVRDRHLDYFLELALLAEPNLRAKDQVAWLDRLDEELDNIRSAIEWSLATRIEDGLQLAAALQWFWWIRNHVNEGIDWLSQLLEVEARTRGGQPPDAGRLLARGNALNAAGILLVHAMIVRGQVQAILERKPGDFPGAGPGRPPGHGGCPLRHR